MHYLSKLQVANSIKFKLSPGQSECSSYWPLGKILSLESAIPFNPLLCIRKRLNGKVRLLLTFRILPNMKSKTKFELKKIHLYVCLKVYIRKRVSLNKENWPQINYFHLNEPKRKRTEKNNHSVNYRVIRWIRTQKQGCCELVLGLVMCLKASVSP